MIDPLGAAFVALVREGEVYVILLPVYVLLVGGERLAHALSGRRWDDRDAAANIAITVGFLLIDVGVGALAPVALMALLHEAFAPFTLSGGWGWLAAFVLYDLAWYVDHRIAHRTGLFWAMHHVHHSSPEFNTTVASRGFLLDATMLSRPTFYLLPLLGVSPLHFIVVKIVTNVWGIAQHTRLVGRLGWLDGVLATPSNHRVHHGTDALYLDRNYGEVLIVWDRLFGTWQPERHPPNYGVTQPIDSHDPLTIELAGLRWLGDKMRRCARWQDAAACLFRPPEWRPGPEPGPQNARQGPARAAGGRLDAGR